MADLYEALGVAKDAKADEIRRAYRKAAKRAHPDGGGSVESFALVRCALDTLSDDKSRAHYDATGEVGEKPVDQTEAMAMTIAMNAIDSVLAAIAQRRARPEEFNVVSDATKHLRNLSREIVEKIANTKTNADQLRKLAKRFKAKKGKANRIGPMFLARADENDRNVAKGREEKQRVDRAIAILREHDFDANPAEMRYGGFPAGNSFFATGTL